MGEADLLRAIEAQYNALPKARRTRLLKELEAEGHGKFLREFFPELYKQIHAEEDAKQRKPKRRKKLLRKRS